MPTVHSPPGVPRGIGAAVADLRTIAGCILTALAVHTTSAAEGPADWPRWRGHEGGGQGGEVALPDDWTAVTWKWTGDLPGQGHSSPVVFRGGVYTASADEAAGLRFVTCHAAADGRLRWQREFAGPIEPHHAHNSSASGTVAASEDGVYWLWATKDNLRAEALSHTGEPLWHVDLGPYACQHGFGASPVVWRDLVIVPIDQDGPSAIVALDAKTGRERWRTVRESGRAAYSTPLVLERADGSPPQVVLASNAHGLTGLDPVTGRVCWESRCFPRRTVSSPIVVGGAVVNVSADGEVIAIADGDAFEVLGRVPLGETCRATPAVAGGRIYFRSAGKLFAL